MFKNIAYMLINANKNTIFRQILLNIFNLVGTVEEKFYLLTLKNQICHQMLFKSSLFTIRVYTHNRKTKQIFSFITCLKDTMILTIKEMEGKSMINPDKS